MLGSEETVAAWSPEQAFVTAGLLEATPETGKRPNRRGELTRERIIQAATECFTEYGFTRTRISDITHRAGTAQGNFYRHFASIDDVFMAALSPALADLAGATARPTNGSGELESLVAVNVNYLETYTRHRHMLRLLREAAAVNANTGFLKLWLNLRSDYVSRTARWLQRLERNGSLRAGEDIPMLAETLGCMTEQVAYIHIGLPAITPRREEIERLGRALGLAWHRLVPRTEVGAES